MLKGLGACFLALAAGLGAAVAADLGEDLDDARTRVGIRITLPPGVPPAVSVWQEADHILLDLPWGAEFPDDFATSSGGLIKSGLSERQGDRVRLDLQLAAGVLDRVDYEPGAVVLHLKSRFAPPEQELDPEDQYVLGPRDKLLITVHGQTELSGPAVITREGVIIVGLVGEVRAAGLSPRQLSARLSELLGGYVVEPQVDVDVEEYRSQWVMVTGEVNKPGRVPLRGGTRLKEAITEAEGFTELAGYEIVIARERPGTTEPVKLTLSRDDLEGGGKNPPLQNGDVVEVRRARWTYVYGEVNKAGRVSIDDRQMSLMRAITQAGGFTEWADLKHVRIQDKSGAEQQFNVRKIMQNKSADPLLQGGEVIIVPRRFL